MDEFTFTDKQLLERRAATLARREAAVIERLDKMYSQKLTPKRLERIERAADRLEIVQARQAAVADELTNYAEVTGTTDSYAFEFDYSTLEIRDTSIPWGKGTFEVTDSVTDGTFEPGDVLSVKAIGTAPFKSRHVNFKTLTGVEDGDVTTFSFASSNLGKLAQNYDSITFNAVDAEGNVIFASEAIDVTNIV